jgi:hypothetical protein
MTAADVQGSSAAKESRVVAERHQRAMAARDVPALQEIYAPDAVIWHNTDGISLTVAEHLSSYLRNTASIERIIYQDVRLDIFPGGYVQQHVISAPMRGGRTLEISACLVVRLRDGQIIELNEYLDSGAFSRAGMQTEH